VRELKRQIANPASPRQGEVHDKNALLMLERALRRRHHGRLPDTLRISSGALKAFVTWQIENNIDASGYGVRSGAEVASDLSLTDLVIRERHTQACPVCVQRPPASTDCDGMLCMWWALGPTPRRSATVRSSSQEQ
jgi:hypothetical protein